MLLDESAGLCRPAGFFRLIVGGRMNILWRYIVPITFVSIGVLTLVRSPDQPVLAIFPFASGKYQLELSALFFLAGLFAAYALYKSDPDRSSEK